jgi:hypothetical protein
MLEEQEMCGSSGTHFLTEKRDCPARWIQLKAVSVNRYSLQGEEPRFSVDFDRPHLKLRDFLHRLIQDLGFENLISNDTIYCTCAGCLF